MGVDMKLHFGTAYYPEEMTLDRIRYDAELMRDAGKFRVYGELLNAYGYNAKPGDKEIEVENFYDGTMVKIPLDETLTATQNAKKYFDKYQKMKRTYEALSTLTVEVSDEINSFYRSHII